MTSDDRRFYSTHSRRLVRALTEELYENLYEVLREYICNAVDGNATDINITCRPPFEKMTITDNGEGIDPETWNYMLNNFAISQKSSDTETIGMHGLGIYSGALICKEIILKTKTVDDKEIRVAKFPVSEWLEDIEEVDDTIPKEDSIQKGIYYYLSTEPVRRNTPDSFTTVILSELKESIKKIFTDDNDSFKKFVLTAQKSWPLDFSPEFQRDNSDLYNEITSFYADKKLLGSSNQFVIKVFINGDPVYKWCPTGSKNSQLSYYPINKVLVKTDGRTIAWIWWTLYKDESFIDKYPYIRKWLDYVEKKSKNELIEGEYDGLEIHEEFKDTLSGAQVIINKLTVKELIRKAEPTKKLIGLFLRLKNVMIYNPTNVWDKILQRKRGRQWENCWGEIFVVDNDIYPEMSRKNLRGRKLNKFYEELALMINGELLLGEVIKYHHHGKKSQYKAKLKKWDLKFKEMFEPSETVEDEEEKEVEEEEKAEEEAEEEMEKEVEGEEKIEEEERIEEEEEEEMEKEIEEEEKIKEEEVEDTEELELVFLVEQLKPNEFDSENLSELKKTIIQIISSLNSLNDDEILEILRYFTEGD